MHCVKKYKLTNLHHQALEGFCVYANCFPQDPKDLNHKTFRKINRCAIFILF